VWVSGNWRIVFEFEGENATNVDLVDYHKDSKGERQ
jgi:proteic killer suppression protein